MEERLIIRAQQPSDLAALDRFEQETFGRALDIDRWRWFHLRAPIGMARGYLAADPATGRVVATYSLLPLRLWLDGETVLASLAFGAAVHPAWRRQGLFVGLGRHALAQERALGVAVTLGKPNQAARAGHQRVGWQQVCKLPRLVKTPREAPPHGCREVESFGPELDAFLQENRSRFSFQIEKDSGWLNWRLRRPGTRYRRFVLMESGALRGYTVVKRYEGPKGTVAHLLDLQATDDKALAELVAAAEGAALGCRQIDLWTNPRALHADSLFRLGFEAQDTSDILIALTHAAAFRLPDTGPQDFCYADNDMI